MVAFLAANLDLILAMVLLLALAAYFALSETALFSLSRHDLHEFKSHANRRARLVAQLRQQSRPLLVTILLANLLCTIFFFVLSTVLLRQVYIFWGDVGVAGLALAPVILCAYFGEVMPKILGRTFNVQIAPLVAGPLAAMMHLAGPVVKLLQAAVIIPVHRLINRPGTPAGAFALEELRKLLSMSQHQGVIDRSENALLQRVVRLREIQVRSVMVPRVDMIAFDVNRPLAELRDLFRRTRLSKIPVYDRQIDNILGVVYAKTFLLEKPATATVLRSLVKPVRFTPLTQPLEKLLTVFRESSFQMAIVVDEFGGVAGLVSLEDVVEQLIGDISESGDAPESALEPLTADRWRASGNLSLAQWSDLFGDSGRHLHASTLAGLVCEVLKRIPQVGDQVVIDHLKLTVETMHGPRVGTLIVELTAQNAAGAQPAGPSTPPPTRMQS